MKYMRRLFTDERKGGEVAAYAASIVFAVSLLRFYFIPKLGLTANSVLSLELNGGLLPVVAHLLLLPVILALPAPKWAKAVGYGWVMVDIVTDIMALNGLSDSLYLPIRYGGHIGAAVWILSSSFAAKGWMRIIGIVLGLLLGGFSFIPHGSYLILLPTGFLLPIWFYLSGKHLAKRNF